MRDPDVWLRAVSWTVIVLAALQILVFSFGRDQGIYALVGAGILDGRCRTATSGTSSRRASSSSTRSRRAVRQEHARPAPAGGRRAARHRLLLGAARADVLRQPHRRVLGGRGRRDRARRSSTSGTPGNPRRSAASSPSWGSCSRRREGHRKRRLARFLLVGAVFGAAALLKPPLGGGALVCAAYLYTRERSRAESWRAGAEGRRRAGRRRRCSRSRSARFGSPLRGGWDALVWTLRDFTPGYTALGWEGRRAPEMLYHALLEAFFKFSALGTAGVIAAITISPMHHPRARGSVPRARRHRAARHGHRDAGQVLPVPLRRDASARDVRRGARALQALAALPRGRVSAARSLRGVRRASASRCGRPSAICRRISGIAPRCAFAISFAWRRSSAVRLSTKSSATSPTTTLPPIAPWRASFAPARRPVRPSSSGASSRSSTGSPIAHPRRASSTTCRSARAGSDARAQRPARDLRALRRRPSSSSETTFSRGHRQRARLARRAPEFPRTSGARRVALRARRQRRGLRHLPAHGRRPRSAQ